MLKANRQGNILVTTVMLLVALSMASIALFTYHMLLERTIQARNSLSTSSFGAESVARVMSDHLLSLSSYKFSNLTQADLDSLEVHLDSITPPPGLEISKSESGYTLVATAAGVFSPLQTSALETTTFIPRLSFLTPPVTEGEVASTTKTIRVQATVRSLAGGERRASMDIVLAEFQPHQYAIYTDGDSEICITAPGSGSISGKIRAEGNIRFYCAGNVDVSGDVLAYESIHAVESGKAYLHWDGGSTKINTVSLIGNESNLEASLQKWGGRLRLLGVTGGTLVSTQLQSDHSAGSGECPDFDSACAGNSNYFPSLTLQRTTTGSGLEYTATCGHAYNGSDCSTDIQSAVSYYPLPWTDASPAGMARLDPDNPTLMWKGLFPDFRRESRCTAEVNDSTAFRTFRCPTNPYGFIIDGSLLPSIPGGLLSIRKWTNTNSNTNPSGYQEVVLIRNASSLPSALTIHSELPVYIMGSYNSVTSHAAMIDAPLITVMPASSESQLQSAALWDSTSFNIPRNLQARDRVKVHAVLRSPYYLTGSNYYGGTVEHIPSVLGDWSNVSLEVYGALEGRVSNATQYASAFYPTWTAPTEMRPIPPVSRSILFDTALKNPGGTPPGSWLAENIPSSGAGGTRTRARQIHSSGGDIVAYIKNFVTTASPGS